MGGGGAWCCVMCGGGCYWWCGVDGGILYILLKLWEKKAQQGYSYVI